MRFNLKWIFLLTPLALAACASAPVGPSQMALPGNGKNFDQFRADDQSCRDYAQYSVQGKTPNGAGDSAFAKSAATGTVLGAAMGAAVGGGQGAGVGAAAGLLAGTVAGANQSDASSYSAQRRYDNSYTQCMYAKGNKVAVSGGYQDNASPYYEPARPRRYERRRRYDDYDDQYKGNPYPPPPY